ncbi:MAG: hypothetical protein KKD86_17525 [Bacteroidetes bacterium]|nr:hypothetical protein [Bacteroidota bacterium]
MTPDWAPNIHPIIVHFPIALLIVAVFFHFLSLFFKKPGWLSKTTMSLYVIGSLSSIAAFFSGRAAADSLDLPSNVINTLTDHADWAEYTMWFFGLFTIVYIIFWLFEEKYFKNFAAYIKPFLFIFGFSGLFLVYQTGDNGAKMVYGYGLGTGNIKEEIDKPKDGNSKTEGSEETTISTISTSENGSWKFYSAEGSVATLKNDFIWIEGNNSDVGVELISNSKESFIKLSPNGNSPMLMYGEKLDNIQIELRANLDSLDGTVTIAHHFIDKKNYDFVSFYDKKVEMGRITAGKVESFEKSSFVNTGWIDIKIISSGTHFRTVINGKVIVHGHDDEVKPGTVGIRFNGTGSFLMSSLGAEIL